jgi:hypothetical protein
VADEGKRHDPAAIVAQYRGAIRGGHIEGFGIFLDRDGLFYEGEWKAGLMHGQGRLQLPGGDEYVGEFRVGQASGSGRYIDASGEIYEGPFADGRRHGRGTTTLPNGRSYRSLWTRGQEDETSRLVRLAQAPGTRLRGASDDVRIAITLDKRLPPSSRTDDPLMKKGDLWYSVSNAANGLLIRPDNKRLMGIWKGGSQIQLLREESHKNFDDFGVVSLVRGQLVPLNLIVEVQNRSSSQIQIAGVSVDVDSSVTDLQPAIQMSDESAFKGSDDQDFYHPYYFIENFGWGAAKNAKLNFAFAGAGTSPKKGAPARTQELGDIERSVKVDFEPHLQALGVDIGMLKRTGPDRFRCKSTNRAGCLREVRAAGLFGPGDFISIDEANAVIGVAAPSTRVARQRGQDEQDRLPFNITITLGSLMQESELGEAARASHLANHATARAGGQLPPRSPTGPASPPADRATGRAARSRKILLARLRSRCSSPTGGIKSRPINLLYYRPRWFTPSNFDDAVADDDTRRNNYDLVGNDLQRVDKGMGRITARTPRSGTTLPRLFVRQVEPDVLPQERSRSDALHPNTRSGSRPAHSSRRMQAP